MYMPSAPPVQQHTRELWQEKEDGKPCVTSVTIFMPQEKKYLPNFTFLFKDRSFCKRQERSIVK